MAGKQSLAVGKFGIPNILSVFRLVLIPIFVAIYITDKKWSGIIVAVLLLLSGITDVLDGVIARKFNMISDLGKILDPLADKLTQAAICICLVVKRVAPLWILCILIIKEFVMIGAGANIIRKGKAMMSSKWFGKLGTVVFYVVMITIIAFEPSRRVIDLLLAVVLACMVFSLIMYTPSFFKIISKRNQKT